MSEQDDLDKDNQDWLDILAGKQVLGANPNTIFEACTLRLGLANQEENLPKASQERLQKIIVRLKKEGYLKPERVTKRFFFTWRWDKVFLGIGIKKFATAFSTLLLLVIVVFSLSVEYRWWDSGDEEIITAKPIPKYAIVLLDSKPEQKAQLLYALFKALGIGVNLKLNQYDDRIWEVEALLSEELSEEQEKQLNIFLEENEWTVPSGFDLLVKIASFYVNYRFHPYPQEKVTELQEAFTKQGAEAEVTQLSDILWRLDIRLPETDSEALIRLMGNHNLIKSSERYVRVEIEAE